MNAARRDAKKRGWPRGLYQKLDGYFYWRHPSGETWGLGRISLAEARAEAIAANLHIADAAPKLVDRISGASKTFGELLDKMPAASKVNTAKSWRSLDKTLRTEFGALACHQVTTMRCAALLEAKAEKHPRTAQALRSRLMAVCQRGQQLGWMDSNPAEPTATPLVLVQRGRLTIEMFHAIYAQAPRVNEWLQRVMMYGLVLGADRATMAGLKRTFVVDQQLVFGRGKTGVRIAVPLVLRMDAVGVSLGELVAHRTGVLSPYLLHHIRPHGNAPRGAPLGLNAMSRAFTAARVLAGIPDVGPDGKLAPTLHELRSLCKRTYDAQGGVDTGALLGHETEQMKRLYANSRGAEVMVVKIA